MNSEILRSYLSSTHLLRKYGVNNRKFPGTLSAIVDLLTAVYLVSTVSTVMDSTLHVLSGHIVESSYPLEDDASDLVRKKTKRGQSIL